MNFFKNLYEQLRSVWRQSGAAGRVGLVAATALCVAVVIGVGIWSSQPDYVALASNLEPAQSSAIVAKLAEDIEKSAKPDCRNAHSGMGLLAVVPLAADALKKDGGCKW